jgi:hypothetical protein
MNRPSRCRRPAALVVALLVFVGCGKEPAAPTADMGTTATLVLPESGAPVLTPTVAGRMKPGIAQDEALAILQEAARDTPSARSSVEAVVTQGRMNPIRYDLTVGQGPRKLVLRFKGGKLVEASKAGFD